MDPFSLAAISAGLGFASDAGNAVSSLWTNKKQREFSREMYERTRADNIEFWNMSNAYNSPEEQMKRFSSAGLNPNLIYGNAGNNSAGNIPTPDVQPVNLRAPQFRNPAPDLLGTLMAQADLRIKNAQANNLNEQTEVIRQDATLRGLQAKQAGFNFDFATEFRGLSADALSESVRQKRVFTDLAINRDAREAIMNSSNVREAAERILNLIETRKGFVLQRGQTTAETARIYENIKLMQKDGRLKDFEIMLNKSNVSKSDPLWQRLIADFLSGNGTILTPLERIPSGTRFPHGNRD